MSGHGPGGVEEQLAAALATFVVEAGDLLHEMEAGLLALEAAAGDGADGGETATETVNALFRCVHTIKGSSGLFGLDAIVAFAHVVENLLDQVRAGEVPVTPALVGALLPCGDHLAGLVSAVGEGRTAATPEEEAAGAALLSALRPFSVGVGREAGAAGEEVREPGDVPDAETGADADGAVPVLLSLRFGPDCLRTGMDPLSFVRFLAGTGEVEGVACIDATLPPVDDFDPETCYLAFLVAMRTTRSREDLEGVFDFVRDESDIRVVMPDDPAAVTEDLVASYGEHAGAVAQALATLRVGGAQEDSAEDLPGQDATPVDAVPDVVPAPPPAAVGPVPGAAGVPAPRAASEARTIRVDADRLDRLIDSVGELVIAGAGAGLRADASGDESLQAALGDVMRLVEEVRDGALQLRMVPIGTTFGRFQRVVRDVGAALGKDVGLVVRGGDTEVDKSLVEQIADPLTHLVRNALDHGIESTEERIARGKPARGTLELNAFHDSGSIVIEVSDDGGGIDTDRVLARAVERGLVPDGAALTERDVHDLVFEPGFSTAETVSDLSGRGVGMDVVRRNVTSLRGTIEVDSRPGRGTTFRIRLPLTLAIIDGFLVGVGDATYVVPLDRVVECVELPSAGLTRDCMDLRGEVLPFVRLRSHFGIAGEAPRRENVVVVEYAGTRTGLVVDTLKGEFQTVIKPLGRLFGHVQGVGGATILGNGDVALIIDVPVLVQDAGRLGAVAVP